MLVNKNKTINPEQGLPEELFLEISGLVPITNVDLFILDDKGRLLLTWREDKYFGRGWHLPGGCIRFKETMLERVQKTALDELKTPVRIDEEPIAIKDVIVNEKRLELENQNTRAHHIAILFRCYLEKEAYVNEMICEKKAGWFPKIPSDILDVHSAYNDVFEKYSLLSTL